MDGDGALLILDIIASGVRDKRVVHAGAEIDRDGNRVLAGCVVEAADSGEGSAGLGP